jgi:hypothetical protein
MMFVPNPDGKTYDLLQWYWPHYGGPTEVVIMDLGAGQMRKDKIPDGLQIHICGRALAPNGKLYFAADNGYVPGLTNLEPTMFAFVPEPATLALVMLGGLGVLARRKK